MCVCAPAVSLSGISGLVLPSLPFCGGHRIQGTGLCSGMLRRLANSSFLKSQVRLLRSGRIPVAKSCATHIASTCHMPHTLLRFVAAVLLIQVQDSSAYVAAASKRRAFAAVALAEAVRRYVANPASRNGVVPAKGQRRYFLPGELHLKVCRTWVICCGTQPRGFAGLC